MKISWSLKFPDFYLLKVLLLLTCKLILQNSPSQNEVVSRSLGAQAALVLHQFLLTSLHPLPQSHTPGIHMTVSKPEEEYFQARVYVLLLRLTFSTLNV